MKKHEEKNKAKNQKKFKTEKRNKRFVLLFALDYRLPALFIFDGILALSSSEKSILIIKNPRNLGPFDKQSTCSYIPCAQLLSQQEETNF